MKEKIKSYILALLILTCILQVGILWNRQNRGFPFSFIAAFFSRASGMADDAALKEKYLIPFRIIASDGNSSYWIIGRNDTSYSEIWSDARSCINRALSSMQASIMPAEEWGTLVAKRGFMLEFKYSIRLELLKWLLDMKNVNTEDPPVFNKVMIVPGMYNNVDIYLKGPDRIYRYEINTRSYLSASGIYEKVLSGVEKDRAMASEVYTVIGEMYGQSRPPSWISPDILCVTADSEKRYRRYGTLDYHTPLKDMNIEQAAEIIFTGNEKDSYDSYEDNDGTIVFMNLDNIYRIYNTGLLEYEYRPGYMGYGRGSQGMALAAALKFINKIESKLDTGAGIYLAGIKEDAGFYEFTFDYMVKDTPVYINLDNLGGEEKHKIFSNAVVIKANEKRILECRWILKRFDVNSSTEGYDLNILSILSASRLDGANFYISDMGISYVVDSVSGKSEKPVWAMETSEGKRYFVPLNTRRGE